VSKPEPESKIAVKHPSSNTLVIETELHEDDIQRAYLNVRQMWATLKDDREQKLETMSYRERASVCVHGTDDIR